jgi:gamma-glutamyltranspeptidase
LRYARSFPPGAERNQHRQVALSLVRIGSRKWTAAHIGQLLVFIDAGSSAASAAIALKRSISVVQNKARSLGKPFPIVASRR